MARTVGLLKEVKIDLLHAVKRAHLHRGNVLGRRSPGAEATKFNTNKSDTRPRAINDTAQQPVTKEQEDHKKTEEGPERLLEAAESSQEILFEAETVFPFTPFPHTVTLDREKLTIADREFFKVAKIISVPIADMLSVEADVGPFFGSLHVTSRYFTNTVRTVRFLTRADAIKMQRMLQGYIIAHERKIDCTGVDKEQLKILLEDLGQGVSD